MTGNMPANLKMIGGEMQSWSELAPLTGGPALAELLRAVVRPGASVLLAGPHRRDVLDALAGTQVTVLLRALTEAEAIAADFPHFRVVCGSVVKLPEETFDVVVALAGLPRLVSVEGAQPSWGEVLDRLARAVAPGGSLLMAAENPLGVHSLVAFGSPDDASSDEAWRPVGSTDSSRPSSVEQLRRAITAAGLTSSATYAGYPTPAAPVALVTEAMLSDMPAGVIAASCAAIPGPVLSDPRRIATEATRAGLAVALAPVWLTVATRDASAGDAAPDGVLAEVDIVPALRAPVRLNRAADGTLLRETTMTAPLVQGSVTREVSVLNGAVPAGRLLGEVLLGHVLRRDMTALRGALAAYADWLAGTGESAVFATVDRVLVDGDDHALLDPSWRWTAPVRPELALASAMRDLAVTLITEGHPHAWPASVDADGLTVVLAGLAGREIGRPVVTEATALTASVATTLRGLAPEETAALREALVTAGTGSVSLTVDSHREAVVAAEAGRAEVMRLRAVLTRTEGWLADSERNLKTTQRQLKTVKESRAYQIGLRITRPVNKVKRILRGGK